MENKEQVVLDAMAKAGRPVKGGEIAESTGLDQKEVTKIINNLKKQGKVNSPKHCFYGLA
jgi:biotin operon repressor